METVYERCYNDHELKAANVGPGGRCRACNRDRQRRHRDRVNTKITELERRVSQLSKGESVNPDNLRRVGDTG